MLHFDGPQDEINFWSKSAQRTELEIAQLKEEIKQLEDSLEYSQVDIQRLATNEDVNPDYDKAAYQERLRNEFSYSRLFKSYSLVRYLHRHHLWTETFKDKSSCPALNHYMWWFLHNCVAHIVMGILPCRTSFKLHDWTSHRLNMPWQKTPWHKFPQRSDPNYETNDSIISVAEKAGWCARG